MSFGFYSYELINIYQNIAWRKNETATASDKFSATFENTRQRSVTGKSHRHTQVVNFKPFNRSSVLSREAAAPPDTAQLGGDFAVYFAP